MSNRYVRYGLNLVTAAVLLVIIATYFHGHIASIASLSPSEEARLIFLGLFWGGICGCVGIIVTVAGIVRNSGDDRTVPLMPTLVILAGAIILFLILLYSSFSSPGLTAPKPGETITI